MVGWFSRQLLQSWPSMALHDTHGSLQGHIQRDPHELTAAAAAGGPGLQMAGRRTPTMTKPDEVAEID